MQNGPTSWVGRMRTLGLPPLLRYPAFQRALQGLSKFSPVALGRGVGRGSGSSRSLEGQVKVLCELTHKVQGLIVLDVGANDGHFALDLYHALREHAPSFHLFESGKQALPRLHALAPRIPGARVVPTIASDTDGIETPTLDTYLAREGIERVHILRIDVADAVKDVLDGAEKSLQSGIIDTVMFGLGPANADESRTFQDLWEIFDRHGYQLFRIVPGGCALEVLKYDDVDERFRGTAHYVAITKTFEVEDAE